MTLDFRTTTHECYVTKSGKQISINKGNSASDYTVTLRMPGMLWEEVATNCTHSEAMRIAKEQYYAR